MIPHPVMLAWPCDLLWNTNGYEKWCLEHRHEMCRCDLVLLFCAPTFCMKRMCPRSPRLLILDRSMWHTSNGPKGHLSHGVWPSGELQSLGI